MSHFSKVSKANIVSQSAFVAAAKELGYEAVVNGTIRGWQGRKENVDVAVTIPDYHYDIGIKKNGNKFDLIAEDMFDKTRLGKIVQITTKHTLINQYRKLGFVARVNVDAKQNVVVTLSR